MKFTTTLAILFSASTTILAAPVRFAARDVWVPKILEPTAETTWEVGKTYSVKWALDQEPASVTNLNGTIFLSKNGRLNITHPLAKGFNLEDGSVSVTIPEDTANGSDYAVVLMGDSGNASPLFKILT